MILTALFLLLVVIPIIVWLVKVKERHNLYSGKLDRQKNQHRKNIEEREARKKQERYNNDLKEFNRRLRQDAERKTKGEMK